MIKLKDGDNTCIKIGNNHIKYYNEILKIKNISRTWIFRFTNVERRKFEEEKRIYNNAKAQYERSEKQKRSESTKNRCIAAAVCFILSIFLLSSGSGVVGFLLLCLAGIIAYAAYRESKREIDYPQQPPVEREFPDKFGLGIEMNSGYRVTFTAIGKSGVQALSKLQNEIDKADVHEIRDFNMNEYNITVENNEGIINAGDNAENSFYRED